MDDFPVIDKAVAGIGQHGRQIDLPAGQFGDDGCSGHLAMVVGHVAAFGHGGSDLNRVTQHMHVFGGG